jgi:hypothetical protein
MIPARIKQHAANAKAHAQRLAENAKYPGTVSGLIIRWGPIFGGMTILVMYAR